MNLNNRLKLIVIALLVAVPSIVYAVQVDVYCYDWYCGAGSNFHSDCKDPANEYKGYKSLGSKEMNPKGNEIADPTTGKITLYKPSIDRFLVEANDFCKNQVCGLGSKQPGPCTCGGYIHIANALESGKDVYEDIRSYFDATGNRNPACP